MQYHRDIELFNHLLNAYKLSKKEFAKAARIPYATVAGWTTAKKAPLYAFELAKSIIREKHLQKDIHIAQYKNKRFVDLPVHGQKGLIKRVEVAFWGKNIDPYEAIKKAKSGDERYYVPIMVNMERKEAVRLLFPKNVRRFAKKSLEKIGPQRAFLYTKTL